MKHAPAAELSPAEIHVHIEHLVLEGLPLAGSHGHAVQAALERELGRLALAVHASAWQSQAAPRAAAPPMTPPAETGAAAWGRKIARTVATTIFPPPSH